MADPFEILRRRNTPAVLTVPVDEFDIATFPHLEQRQQYPWQRKVVSY